MNPSAVSSLPKQIYRASHLSTPEPTLSSSNAAKGRSGGTRGSMLIGRCDYCQTAGAPDLASEVPLRGGDSAVHLFWSPLAPLPPRGRTAIPAKACSRVLRKQQEPTGPDCGTPARSILPSAAGRGRLADASPRASRLPTPACSPRRVSQPDSSQSWFRLSALSDAYMAEFPLPHSVAPLPP